MSLLLSSSWPHPEKDSERERERKEPVLVYHPPHITPKKKEIVERNKKKVGVQKSENDKPTLNTSTRQLNKNLETSKNVLSNKKRENEIDLKRE